VCSYIEHRFRTDYAPIVVVAEGAMPTGGDMILEDASRDSR
jgi:ATP-dependent phosphofructokinase / diphosphate-dependent phosphofructokinase